MTRYGMAQSLIKQVSGHEHFCRVTAQTPKKQNSEESKAATHNAVVSAEGNGGSGVSGWRMSSALGGRFLPLDMVFSEDEK